jgi:hypothetical protein
MRLFLALSLLLTPLVPAVPVEPKPDSKELQEILAAVTDPNEDALHQAVTF